MPPAEPGAAQAEEFMSVAAHDLRNPIAVVRASAQMAQRQIARGDADAARGRIAAIVDQTDRLTEMLETFLDAARAAAGRLPLRPEEVDVRELIESSVERSRSISGERSERVLDLDIPGACVGVWDAARIARAVRALIQNAFLYGDPQAPIRVKVRPLGPGDRMLIQVSGGGRGPDGDEAAHLFERFYRGRSAAEVGHAGSGLGLYTARGIARAHGGDVRRSSEPADGFEIELPLRST
jgi:two-component system, NtrC family, sensor histidine kinase KinB